MAKVSPTVALIDWQNPPITALYLPKSLPLPALVERSSFQDRRPDIVCFVNGIPLL